MTERLTLHDTHIQASLVAQLVKKYIYIYLTEHVLCNMQKIIMTFELNLKG